MSELVPTRVRSKAMSLFLSVNWATNLLVAFLTLTAIDGLGQVRSDMNDDQTAAAEKKGVNKKDRFRSYPGTICVFLIRGGLFVLGV